MKSATAIVAGLLAAVSAQAQGTINVVNRVGGPGGLDAPVFVALYHGTFKAEGAGYLVHLYAGPNQWALVPIGAPVPFHAGSDAGYWNPAPSALRTVELVLLAPRQLSRSGPGAGRWG
jgi:hypothetical protein